MTSLLKLLSGGLLLAGLMGSVACSTTTPPPVVSRKVDLDRFMGDWYVIGGKLTWLEKNAHNGIENYRLNPDGTIATTYTFREGGFDGPVKRYHPTGFVWNRENNAEWGMQFLWPFKAAYLILYLDDEYRHTAIGVPDRDYVWIMAREPVVSPQQMNLITQRLAEVGYDVSTFRMMPQQWPEKTPR